MDVTKPQSRLCIYLSSTDKLNRQTAYEALVYLAKEQGLAGATVLRGVLGYGASSTVHSARFWEYTEKLPMVIEIIDDKEKIESFFEFINPKLNTMQKGCLVTMEDILVKLYRSGNKTS